MSPIYTYYCETCKNEQEEIFTIKNRPDAINCTKCNSVARFGLSPTQFTVNGANAANRYSGDSNYRWLKGDGDE